MNKSQLIEAVATETELAKTQAEAVLNATLKIIRQTVAAGDSVRLFEFGTFEACWRTAREGRNIQTGETIEIPATRVAKFSPAKAFKEQVSGTTGA